MMSVLWFVLMPHFFFSAFCIANSILLWHISVVLFLCCTRHRTFTYVITIIKEGVVFLGHSPLCCDMLVWHVIYLLHLFLVEVTFENQYWAVSDHKGYVDVCALFHLCDVISLCICSSVSVLELRIFFRVHVGFLITKVIYRRVVEIDGMYKGVAYAKWLWWV
jgi:hypothetical protein